MNPSHARLGWMLGLAGVLAFSLSLPMTRLAVAGLPAGFVAAFRMAGAGVLALAWVLVADLPRPRRDELGLLALSSFGVVFGFPLFSTLAMAVVDASHGAIVNGLLPFATAVAAAVGFGERQPLRFWIWAGIGSLLVLAFATQGASLAPSLGDAAMLAAVLTCAVGYAAGARLSTRMGGVATIAWSLVLALPLSLPAAWLLAPAIDWTAVPASAWLGLAYVTLIAQFFAFFAWYNGLAWGGIARVGQLQLLQLFMTLAACDWLFGETVAPSAWAFAAAVVATIVLGRRPSPPSSPAASR